MSNKKLTITLALTVGFVSPAAPILAANISTTVLASGLNNPRGMTFGPDGQLYIAQAGRGGNGTCILSGGQSQVCYGPTSAIARLNTTTGATEVLIDNLPSLAQQPSGNEGTGLQDLYFDQSGQLFG
ncbi:MAG: ScyD/ScyE family protein, partial [Microcystis sp. M49629_WE12]|nr:ScyD/ScyE family protein [Microcystis sp. M53600_WE12]MDJ0562584.1 ScyD/ScyE family protein [Microcystis sp. M49629_WE12]